MKVSKRDKNALNRHQYLFKTVSSVGKDRRDRVLKTAPKSLFPTAKMLAKHLVKGNIPLTAKHRKKLNPKMKRLLRQLHVSKTPQKTVTQNGTGFAQILRFVLPIIGPLLSSI